MTRLPYPAAALLGILVLAGCGEKPPEAPKGGGFAPPVGVASGIEKTLPVTKVFTGRIEPIESVELRPRVSGQVVEVMVADGAVVKAGDVILRLDDAPFRATVAKGEADIARAEADIIRAKSEITRVESKLKLASQQYTRAKQLVKDQTVSRQAFDDAEAAIFTATAEKAVAEGGLAVATAALASAKAAAIAAQLDLDHTRVIAPIDGALGKIITTVGSVVQGGGPAPATLLATIVRSDSVYAAWDLDEATFAVLAARLHGAGPVAVSVGLTGEGGYPHPGVVTFAENQFDTAAGAIRVRATLDNPHRLLTPGAFARISVELAAPRPVLLINERAVQAQLATRYVLTVDEKGATAFRPVQLGERFGLLRIVDAGLKPGELIAVNNLAKIFFPGMPVMPVPASMETLENAGPPPGAPAAPAAPKAEAGAEAKVGEGKKP